MFVCVVCVVSHICCYLIAALATGPRFLAAAVTLSNTEKELDDKI